jgi:hypothetical protein
VLVSFRGEPAATAKALWAGRHQHRRAHHHGDGGGLSYLAHVRRPVLGPVDAEGGDEDLVEAATYGDGMAKYDGLRDFLQKATADHVTYSFTEVGDTVGGLPPSASDHREWWANSSSPQARAWLGAGFRVEMVNVASGVVRFVRTSPVHSQARAQEARSAIPAPITPQVASMPQEFDLGVRGSWHDVGDIGIVDGALSFPTVPAAPAVYRFLFRTTHDVESIYVGESVDVRRRMRNYRRPSPRQQTSTRLHHLLRTRLELGDTVTLGLLADILVQGERRVPVDLASKAIRVLIEHAALVALADAGYEVHNL